MFHELEVMASNCVDWERIAVSDKDFAYIKPDGLHCSAVYDIDNCRILTVRMRYDDLVAKLNGQTASEEPEPVEVECWGVFSGTKLIMGSDSKHFADKLAESIGGVRTVRMKGTYTRG